MGTNRRQSRQSSNAPTFAVYEDRREDHDDPPSRFGSWTHGSDSVSSHQRITALRLASPAWSGLVVFATLFQLVLAILGVVYRRNGQRAFWLGFTLFGWGYMVLASGSWWHAVENQPKLITTMLLDRVDSLLRPSPVWDTRSGAVSRLLNPEDQKTEQIRKKLEQPISMPFVRETPLGDVIRYVKSDDRPCQSFPKACRFILIQRAWRT